jgi:hypothetical protein
MHAHGCLVFSYFNQDIIEFDIAWLVNFVLLCKQMLFL